MTVTTVYLAIALLMSKMFPISLCYKQCKLFCFKFASLEPLHKCHLLREATPGHSKITLPSPACPFPFLCLIFFIAPVTFQCTSSSKNTIYLPFVFIIIMTVFDLPSEFKSYVGNSLNLFYSLL